MGLAGAAAAGLAAGWVSGAASPGIRCVKAQIGIGTAQTFQVRLYVDGSIQFSYSGVSPTSAVVGIAPGSAAQPVAPAEKTRIER